MTISGLPDGFTMEHQDGCTHRIAAGSIHIQYLFQWPHTRVLCCIFDESAGGQGGGCLTKEALQHHGDNILGSSKAVVSGIRHE